MSRPRRRVVVVGSGIAGLAVALEASGAHDVLLLTKAGLSQSNTAYAQGGIAAVLPDSAGAVDSVAAHVADTLAAGAGLARRDAVEVLCAEAAERIADLVKWGVCFDQAPEGGPSRGLEAAHSAARVLHAGGDATGAVLQRALVQALGRTGAQVEEGTFVRDLVIEDEEVTGVRCITRNGGERVHSADAVVLASGGAGQLYPYTTNPRVATGDGVAAALRAGVVLRDLELYQFHPTALAAARCPLISEAVRGEGAILRDADGRRFLGDIHPAGELAPRDVVARGIAAQMARQGGEPVRLDATSLGADFLARRFPSIDALCRDAGYDWSREPVPVTPAAHYWMGGVRTDLSGRSSLPGLYAVGEVASTGVHGANRLASNSLLEGAVYAHRCVRSLDAPEDWPHVVDDADALHVQESHPHKTGRRTVVDRTALQRLMWDSAGLYRHGDQVADAIGVLEGWQPDQARTVAACEDANLLDIGRAVLSAADARRESRGAHTRTDHPEPAEPARHVNLTRKVPA